LRARLPLVAAGAAGNVMMRVAAIYDIHANLPALDAVLEEIRGAAVDLVLVGGDVLPGPMPRETLARLTGLDIPARFIRGNGDRAVLQALAGTVTGEIPESYRETMEWVARQLGPRDAEVLASWPATLEVEIDGLGDVLFCHATPRNDTEIFTRLTTDERLRPAFDGVHARIVVCGHTHMTFDRTVGSLRVVNAGSVGMPFGAAGADWLLLGPDVERRHTPYDLDAAAARIRDTAYPQAEQFATQNVLRPPSAEQMLELFGRSELE
jgi:diadenosine tetraphosphatase ApaH/serine/threonine PP2A family protein phosphatase